jgi:hypothetical protein
MSERKRERQTEKKGNTIKEIKRYNNNRRREKKIDRLLLRKKKAKKINWMVAE